MNTNESRLLNQSKHHNMHGQCYTRLYNIWTHIKQRCTNPNDDAYKNYGGRGINICEEWSSNFSNFYEWRDIRNGQP